MNLWRDDGYDDDNDNNAQTSVGGGNDGDRTLSLTQEAEDRRAEPQVAPQRGRTAGGVATTRGGHGDGDVEAPTVRAANS
jgi:hypothetical protein